MEADHWEGSVKAESSQECNHEVEDDGCLDKGIMVEVVGVIRSGNT